jgi:hypothetical protein
MLGKVFNEITFTGQVPSLAGIVDRIEELGGLSVSIADKSNSDRSFRASLSLPELARNKLEIYAKIRSKSNAIDSSLAPDTSIIDRSHSDGCYPRTNPIHPDYLCPRISRWMPKISDRGGGQTTIPN